MTVTRRALTVALSFTGSAALLAASPFRLTTEALASNSTNSVVDPVPLPEMALGPADAPVTIAEYASITCPHCAAFNEKVFPQLKAVYIDTGKVRYLFREFPLDPVAAASSVLARCIAKDDNAKFFEIVDKLFRQDWWMVTKPRETFNQIGKQSGLAEEQVGACLKDEELFNKIVAERVRATNKLGINSTPTFFINDEKIVGATPFEEFDRRIKALLNE